MGELRDSIKDLNVEDFGDFLLQKGVHEDIASLFVNNRITGVLFLKLSEEDLKELIPTIGDRIVVKELLRDASKVTCHIILTFPSSRVSSRTCYFGMKVKLTWLPFRLGM